VAPAGQRGRVVQRRFPLRDRYPGDRVDQFGETGLGTQPRQYAGERRDRDQPGEVPVDVGHPHLIRAGVTAVGSGSGCHVAAR